MNHIDLIEEIAALVAELTIATILTINATCAISAESEIYTIIAIGRRNAFTTASARDTILAIDAILAGFTTLAILAIIISFWRNRIRKGSKLCGGHIYNLGLGHNYSFRAWVEDVIRDFEYQNVVRLLFVLYSRTWQAGQRILDS